jgi:hypothetical protein
MNDLIRWEVVLRENGSMVSKSLRPDIRVALFERS